MSTSAIMKNSSVAAQQKVGTNVDYSTLTNTELHEEMLVARNMLFEKCLDTQRYAADVLVPACEAIIARYKMQGVAAKDRPNSKPTVEAYFNSIGLNYNTVRSWIHRKRLQTEMFQPQEPSTGKSGKDKVRHLTELEARLLGTASAGHDLVKALEQGGNVEAAAKEFLDHAPTPERIEEYIERPVSEAAHKLKGLASQKLARALSAEIARLVEESGNGKRVRICAEGDEPIRYDRESNGFVFTVMVHKQEPTDGQAPESTKAISGGAQ